MDSRLKRYNYDDENNTPSRTERNKDLYGSIDMSDYSRFKRDSNVKVIESSPKTIDINKIKKYIENQKEEVTPKRSIVVKSEIENIKEEPQEKKIYDINSVLERAKEGRESYYETDKYRKLRDTQYDILSKIEMYNEQIQEKEEEFNTDERTLIDLINTVTINKKSGDILSELTSPNSNDEVVTDPINGESTNEFISEIIETNMVNTQNHEMVDNQKKIESTLTKNLDQSFYTNSMSFSKEDFEGFEELEKTVKKNNSFVKFVIFLLVLLGCGTIYVVFKYVLNIF